MYVVRGRGTSIDADRRILGRLNAIVRDSDTVAVRVWRPHRQVAFGPRDVRHDRYGEAAAIARARGFAPVERSVGGHPVAYTGRTIAFTRIEPIDDPRRGLHGRYDRTLGAVREALTDIGIETVRGEPSGAFCPGQHSLAAGGKVVGVAQRVKADLAATSGVVIVADREEIATVLEPVYRLLEVEFDPASVGSVANAGGPRDAEVVQHAIEDRLLGDEQATPLRVTRVESRADTSAT